LEQEFDPTFLQADLVNLPAYNIYLKLMIDGLTSAGFSAKTLPRLEAYRTNNREKIIKVSRERYGRPRKEVEDKIRRWAGTTFQEMAFGEGGRMSAEARMEEKMLRREYERTGKVPQDAERELFNAVCHTCNKVFKLPFKPDPARPVYCRECLPAAQRSRDAGSGRRGEPRNRREREGGDRPRASGPRPRGDRGDRGPRRLSPARPAAPATPAVSMRDAFTKAMQPRSVQTTRPHPSPPPPPVPRPSQKPAKQKAERGELREGDTISFS
ncbi:MAG: CxxC-x17-CxxC domain-containing protein, partial [Parcubacteria group bacterium]